MSVEIKVPALGESALARLDEAAADDFGVAEPSPATI